MCRPVPLLLLLAAFLLACMGAADAKTVIATYALQRHGQRDVITQNTDDSVFGGTPLLAPVGFNQSWWSGAYVCAPEQAARWLTLAGGGPGRCISPLDTDPPVWLAGWLAAAPLTAKCATAGRWPWKCPS